MAFSVLYVISFVCDTSYLKCCISYINAEKFQAFSPNMKYVVSVGFQHDMLVNIWNWRVRYLMFSLLFIRIFYQVFHCLHYKFIYDLFYNFQEGTAIACNKVSSKVLYLIACFLV